MKILSFFIVIAFALTLNISAQKATTKTKKDTIQNSKEIVVTALRYPEKLTEVPMAVSILNNYDLEGIRSYGMDESLNQVPGVLVQSRSGTTDVRLTIRGFGARGAGDRSNSGTSRGIKVLLNGLPLTEPDGRTSFDLVDLSNASSIEIIRSNLSSVWGNAAGGVMNISTIPSTQGNFLQLESQGGSFGFYKYGIQSGLNLGDSKLYLQASNTKFDGFRSNSQGERLLINTGLVAPLSNKTNLEIHLALTNNKMNIPGPLTQIGYDTNALLANRIYDNRDERRNNTLGRIGLILNHNIDENNTINFNTFVEPKFLERSERNTYRNFLRYHVGGMLNYRNTYKISNESENILLVGIDNAYQDGGIMFFTLSPTNQQGTLQTNKREGANTFGIYFQDELKYDKFSLIAGGRYDAVSYYTANFFDQARITTPDNRLTQERTFSKFTPRFGLNYSFDEEQSVYASYGGGIEVPAGNETDPIGTFGPDTINNINPLLSPITSRTIEIGYKYLGDLNGFSRFELTAAAFNIDVENDIVPYRNGRFYFTAGKTNRMGLELGFNLKSKFGLGFNGSVNLMQTKYVEYSVDSVHYDTTKAGRFADFKDNKIAGIPGFNYNLTLSYTFESLENAGIYLNATGISSYFVNDANTIESPAYSVLNLRLNSGELLKFNDKFSLSANLSFNNLLDTKYVASAFINPDLESNTNRPFFIEPGMPFNLLFGLSLRMN